MREKLQTLSIQLYVDLLAEFLYSIKHGFIGIHLKYVYMYKQFINKVVKTSK